KVLRPLWGNGLLASEGDAWLQRRRLMQPLFSAKQLPILTDAMIDAIDVTVARLGTLARIGMAVDMEKEMMELTQGVLLRSMFGTTIGHQEARMLVEALTTALRVINRRLFLYFLPEWVPLPNERKLRDALRSIDDALLRIVQERRRHDRDAAGRDDVLALLLRARDDDS